MAASELFTNKDKKFRLLFEFHPQPMCVFEPDSQQILEANRAASVLYGYSRDEFRARRLPDLDAGIALAEGEVVGVSAPVTTWRHRTASGRVIELETAVHDIEYGGRRAQLAVMLDITGRKQLEEQLRQAQKMEAVGMLAGGVAHDFNNLLTIITGYSQLILNTLGSGDPNRHSVEQIMKAGERAAALTQQLLAFSRRQVLQPKVLDLNKLVTSLSTMLRRLIGEDIDLRLVLPPELGRVSADPGQVEQVLMNLVVNARDAMPKGGILTIETDNVNLDGEYVGRHIAVRPGTYVMLAVSDNGTGMDEATQIPAVRAVLHHQGHRQGDRAGAFHGVRDRQAERRQHRRIQRTGPRYDHQGLPAAHRPGGCAGSGDAAALCPGPRKRCWWWKTTRWSARWCARRCSGKDTRCWTRPVRWKRGAFPTVSSGPSTC